MIISVYVFNSLSGGRVVGKFPPHEAFPIGGTNSVRGYEEGAVGSGCSYVVGSGEMSFPVVSCGYYPHLTFLHSGPILEVQWFLITDVKYTCIQTH